MQSPTSSPANGEQGDYFDVKEAPAFRELDSLVTAFKTSFPAHLKNPIDGQAVDPYLYTACLVPNLAQILLHEAHARPGAATCLHADKILRAARAIVELIYNITATSYDISRLGLHAIMCWFIAGRVLVRFLKAAIDSQSEEHMIPLQTEVYFVRSMVAKAGEKIFLAERYKKMLDDFLFSTCGQTFIDSTPSLVPDTDIDTGGICGGPSRTLDMFMQYKAPPMPPPPMRRAGSNIISR